jgi:hypothetical protein
MLMLTSRRGLNLFAVQGIPVPQERIGIQSAPFFIFSNDIIKLQTFKANIYEQVIFAPISYLIALLFNIRKSRFPEHQ